MIDCEKEFCKPEYAVGWRCVIYGGERTGAIMRP